MYFPVLRGKRFELAAVRELRKKLREWDTVIPIIEPVKTGGLSTTLEDLVDYGVRFSLIINPKVGEFADRPHIVENNYVDEYLDEYDNYYPGFYVDGGTTSKQVSDFASRFDVPVLFVLTSRPLGDAVRSIIDAEPAFVAIRDNRVPQNVLDDLLAEDIELIRVTNPFDRQVRNSDYPDSEFFSDAHLHVPNTFNHVADYSIVGDAYTEGGGAAYTVALHHVVVDRPGSDSLTINHYKSDYSETTTDVAGKFLQALRRLVDDQSNPDPANATLALEEYRELYADEHFAGLGFAKKLGLMHHLEVMGNILPR